MVIGLRNNGTKPLSATLIIFSIEPDIGYGRKKQKSLAHKQGLKIQSD